MSEAVIVALITAGAAIVGQWLLARKNAQDLYAKLDKQSELADQHLADKLDQQSKLTDLKIEELTREVRKHNGFAEKIPVLEEQMRVATHRIDCIENKTAS